MSSNKVFAPNGSVIGELLADVPPNVDCFRVALPKDFEFTRYDVTPGVIDDSIETVELRAVGQWFVDGTMRRRFWECPIDYVERLRASGRLKVA